jgi:fructosamine-3-kinase
VTAILDWDRALWGDPGIEFAVLAYCGFDTRAFWKGYGEVPAADPGTRTRQAFYHLYEVQKYLVIWSLRRKGRADDIRRYKSYCLEAIQDLP